VGQGTRGGRPQDLLDDLAVRQHSDDKVSNFLADALASGPKPAMELMTRARGQGISADTLRRGSKKLGVRWTRQGFGEGSVSLWHLPEDLRPSVQETTAPDARPGDR
jgi:hypothetical protein